MKNELKRVIIRDKNGEMDKIITNREEIEQENIQYNRSYYKKAFCTLIYQDKIYNQLNDDAICDKILDRTLYQSDCNSEEVFEYLQLFKRTNQSNIK
jgi:hypothetical protein